MSYRLLAARRFSPLLAATLAFAAGVSSAHAAVVSWSVPTNILNDGDVSLSRDFVAAYNIGNTGVSATTVNGVTFNPFAIPDGDSTATQDGYAIESSFIFGGLPINTAADYGSAAAPFTSLSSHYQTLLRSGATSTLFQNMSLTLNGLHIGDTYTIQIWTNNSAASAGGDAFAIVDQDSHTVVVDPNVTNADGGAGQFVLGTFVADGTSEYVGIGGTFLFPGGSPFFNAFQLRTTPAIAPEPASALACASATMLLRRPRRR